ncbi:MAG: hypothetical protein IJA34_03830 [Lachnospiraceae bacterium]|nr:hypothetical protein [Lachnospiraceae bacterium]
MKKRFLKRTLSLMLTGVLALGIAFVVPSESVYAFESDYDGIGNVITEVNFDTKYAIVGEYLDTKGFIDYPWYSQLGEIEWYKDGVKVENPSQTKFELDAEYSFKARLQTDNKPEDRFSDDLVAYVNGDEVEVSSYGKYDKKYVVELEYDGVFATDTLKEVNIVGLDRPVIGNVPDKDVDVLDPDKYYVQNDYFYDYDYEVKWYNWGSEMSVDEEFEVGGSYEAVIVLRTYDDYSFNYKAAWTSSRYSLPDVKAYIDGNVARVGSAMFGPYEQIKVSYKFGELDTEGIEYVNIYELPYPIVGNNPEYEVGRLGGCAYYIPDLNENEYQKHGITWMDITDPNNEFYLTEEDEFLIGHEYKIIIDMVTQAGHVFVPDDEDWEETAYSIDITGYGNGTPIYLVDFDGESDTHKKIAFEYICQPYSADEIDVYDIDLPLAGEKPDYSANVMEPDFYQLDENFGINGVEWSYADGTVMQEGETFVEGEIYNVKVKVISTIYEGCAKSVLYSYMYGYINYGKGECVVSYDGDNEYNDTKRYAYINKTFICVQGESIKAGWVQIDDKWYYYDSKGVMAKGWKRINTRWYYFNTDGVMQASKWIGKYYVKSNGVMAVSEFVDGGKYYVDANGAWVNETKWMQLNGKWYYLKSGVVQQSKWSKIAGKWYYFDKNGIMQVSKWINNKYYVKADGTMAVSEFVGDGKYYVDENGIWVNGTQWLQVNGDFYYIKSGVVQLSKWVQVDGKWYYFDKNGIMQVSKWINNKYYVKADGTMAVSEFVGDGKYYVDENGVWLNTTQWLQIGENWYYIESGVVQMSKWLVIDGNTYYFDENGVASLM